MPEYVGSMVQPPDMLGRLSSILGIQQQQQALQGQTAQTQMLQQDAAQRKAIAGYDWSQHMGPDGTPDLNSIANDKNLQRVAGDKYLDVMTHAANAKQQAVAAKNSLYNYTDTMRKGLSEMVGGLRQDPDVMKDNEKGRQKVTQDMVKYGETFGKDALPLLQTYSGPLQQVPQGGLSNALRSIQMQADSVSDQISKQLPNYVGTGQQLENINPNSAGGRQQVPLGFSPSERFPITTNASNQNIIVDRLKGLQAPIGGVNPTGPQVQAATEIATNSAKSFSENINAATQVPIIRNLANNIINLGDQVNTGPKTDTLNKIRAMVGNTIPGTKGWQDESTAYQEITKYMEHLALKSWGAAGGSGSNLQLEAQHAANPNNQYNSDAVKSLAKWVLAGQDAQQAHTNALISWSKQPGNGPENAYEFENKWANVMDPRVFQLSHLTPQETLKTFPSKAERNEIRSNTQKIQQFLGR